MEETIIISLGGSLIVPDEIDVNFLKDFKNLVLSQVAQGKKFVIIAGGGGTNRKYNKAAREIGNPSDEDLDWIGIASLKLNAELVRVIFGGYAHEKVIADFSAKPVFDKPIVVGSAFGPGRSTDWDAVEAAKVLGAKRIINLSNIDYVYDSDPKTNPEAKKIEQISWAKYRSMIPAGWSPRLSSPFDPVASKTAEEEKMTAVIMNGKPVDNLANYLAGKKFTGTIIQEIC